MDSPGRGSRSGRGGGDVLRGVGHRPGIFQCRGRRGQMSRGEGGETRREGTGGKMAQKSRRAAL